MEQTKIYQYVGNKSNNKVDHKIQVKRIIFLVLAALFISVFLYSVKLYAADFDLRVQDKVILNNNPVNAYLTLKNTTSTTNLYTLQLYTSPFQSQINPSSIRLSPGEVKQVNFTVYPLENSTSQEYTSTISVLSNSETYFYTFTIVQQTNKVCPVNVNYKVDYISDSNKYHIDLNIENPTTKYQTITIKEIKPINTAIETMDVALYPNENKHSNFYFDTNSNKVTLSYICNSNYEELNITLPSKPVTPKPDTTDGNKINLNLAGYFTYASFSRVFESLTFQVILILIIILLVLSFTSRYIKLLHLTNYRRK